LAVDLEGGRGEGRGREGEREGERERRGREGIEIPKVYHYY
jgi:hypothetical protein